MEELSAAAGSSVRFPMGGSIEGDMARTIGAALAEQDLGWGFLGTSFPFTVASIDGDVNPGGIDLKVNGQSGEKGIRGSLRIAFPGGAVSGTLLASRSSHSWRFGVPEHVRPNSKFEEACIFRHGGCSDPVFRGQAQPVELGDPRKRLKQTSLDAPTDAAASSRKGEALSGIVKIEAPMLFAILARASLGRDDKPLARSAKFA